MANFIKLLIIILIAIGIIFFFVTQTSDFFQDSPREKITKTSQDSKGTYFTWRDGISFWKPTPAEFPANKEEKPPEISEHLIPDGFTREQLSPYFLKIQVSSVSPNRSQNISSYSTIRLGSYFSSNDKEINITNWRIKSNRHEIVIPKAIRIYNPLVWESEKDIVLSGGNYVYIYSHKSVFNRNLRLNKCIGYLENTYNFIPSLPQNCPSIPRSEFNYLSGECQSYIFSLRGCKLPESSFYNTLPGTDAGNDCRAFLNTISHGSCFKKHRYDVDFLSNEWRVWIDMDILDLEHDRVLLYDKEGLLVDEYSY